MKKVYLIIFTLVSFSSFSEIVRDINPCWRSGLDADQKKICKQCNMLMSEAAKSICTLERSKIYEYMDNFRSGAEVEPSEYKDILMEKLNCETHFVRTCVSSFFN